MIHFISYIALRMGAGLVGLLTARGAQRLGNTMGFFWYLFDRRRRRMARRHMTRVLGPDADVRSVSLRMMRSYGRYLAEAFWVRADRIPAMLENTEVEGLHHVLAARDAGKGMVYALPHMGNWEAAAPVAGVEGIPVVAVAENLPNQLITKWFTRMRAECGIEIVLATGGAEVMRRLEAALAERKAVALPSDRDLRGRGVEVTFFGETTTMPAGPASLAIRNDVPLFPVVSYFSGTGHKVLVRPPITVPETGTRIDRIAAMTQTLAGHFEDFIRAHPEQWHLLVPNWPSDRLHA